MTTVNLSATGGLKSITLNWTTSGTQPSFYQIVRGSTVIATNIFATTYTVSMLNSATSYTHTVRAMANGSTIIGTSNSATATTATVPTAPGAPTVSNITTTSATISWTAPSSNGGAPITNYRLQVIDKFSLVVWDDDSLTGFSSTITTPSNLINNSFTCKVAAINGAGNNVNNLTGQGPYSTVTTFATAPNPPRNVSAIAGDSQATVSFLAPLDGVNGGLSISSYKVTSNPGGIEVSGISSPIVVTGLTNGTNYSFTVTATNSGGSTSIPSNGSSQITPYPIPRVPESLSGTSGNGQVTLTWDAPAPNGDLEISTYAVYMNNVLISPASLSYSGSVKTATISGLTNGIIYSFQVSAKAGAIEGTKTTALAIAPYTVPGAPTSFTATPGNGQVTLQWSPPSSNGGNSNIAYYVYQNGVKMVPPNISSSGNILTGTISGLTNGTSYSFQTSVGNLAGEGPLTSAVNVTPRTVPGAPTITSAVAGDGQVILTLTAPENNGGAAITSYTATSTPESITKSELTPSANGYIVTVTGLTNNTAYTFTATANNVAGSSTPSESSSSVTPEVPPGAPSITQITAGDGQLLLSVQPSETGTSAASYAVYSVYDGSDHLLTVTDGISVDLNANTITQTGLLNGYRYGYKVAGITALGMEGNKSSIVYGVPVNSAALATTVSTTILQEQANGNFSTAIPILNSLIDSVSTEEQKNTIAATAAQSVATNVLAANASTAAGTKISNVASELANVTANLPVERAPVIAQQAVVSVVASNALTLPEKFAALARATHSVGATNAGMKTAFVEELRAQTVLTAAPITLNAEQTTALFAGRSNIVDAPSTVKGVIPVGTTIPLSGNDSIYCVMQPDVNYSFTNSGGSVNLKYNSTTQKIIRVSDNAEFNPGDVITVGEWSGRIFTTGGMGLTPVTTPGEPNFLSATPGNGQVSLQWSAPSSDGGSAIITYWVYVNGALTPTTPASYSFDGDTKTATIGGLTNGTSYSFKVSATNAVGNGQKTSAVSSTPRTTPNAPGSLVATPGNGQVSLQWRAPIINGGSAITTYSVYVNDVLTAPTSYSFDGDTKTATITGLTNGTSYSFKVSATNEVGEGEKTSAVSSTPRTTPGAPRSLVATPGNNQVSLQWSAPIIDGGSVITTYSVYVNDVLTAPASYSFGGAPKTATITGLTNGTSYSFKVSATNAAGEGPKTYETFSTPTAPPVEPPVEPPSSVPCFPPGVRIRTPHGSAPVESLKTGDLVLTADNRVVPIRMHSYSLEETTPATAPYFIPAGAMGPKAPVKPLHLSPLHAFQVRPNVWWCAKEAAKHSSKIQQYGLGEPITYYHVECPNFLRDNLVADGVVVESFAAKQLTQAQKHNLYKYSKKLGGFVRSNPTATKSASL